MKIEEIRVLANQAVAKWDAKYLRTGALNNPIKGLVYISGTKSCDTGEQLRNVAYAHLDGFPFTGQVVSVMSIPTPPELDDIDEENFDSQVDSIYEGYWIIKDPQDPNWAGDSLAILFA